MRLGPPSTLLLVLVLLVAFVAPGAATGEPAAALGANEPVERPDAAVSESSGVALQAAVPEPDGTVIEIRLDADGDAHWTVTQSFNLTDTSDERAFDRVASEFERGEIGGDHLGTVRRANEAVNRSVDRSMAIRNVSRDAVVADGTGRLVTSFTWTSFARVAADTVRVGDVFVLDTGMGTETWFPGLAADERLVVGPPPGYRIDDAPSADSFQNGSLVWEGPTSFESGYLSITYRKLTPPPEPPGSNVTATPPPPGPFEGQLLPVVGGAVGVGALLLAAYLLLRRETPIVPIAQPNGGTDTDEGTDGDGPAGPTAPADASGAEASGAEPEEGDEGSEVDLELLSDEERVEHLLRQNGGRMKQANIVRETNWSNAKVSQLLSAMDEADRIDKLRIGRENLITLPGEDPGDFEE
jgi:hypothetical protein